jgi:hypothetical protein
MCKILPTQSSVILLGFLALSTFGHQSQARDATTADCMMSKGCLHTRMRASEYLTSLKWLHPTTMCAVEESTPDDQRIWFVWREGKQIISWDEPDMPLAASSRILRIPKDVVTTPARIKGSTYKVTQAWVNELEARRKNQGITFSVKGSNPATR